MKHVALVMSLNKRFDRKVIEGVTRFVRESGQWSVFVEDDPKAKIPDFHHGQFDGVIADLDDPRISKRLVGLEIPAVGVGAIREDCPWELDISTVSTNNQRIAELAASHLLERNVCSFAFCGVRGRSIDPWNGQRRAAFASHLKAAGYGCSVYRGRECASHSWEQLQQRLASWLSDLPKPLTGNRTLISLTMPNAKTWTRETCNENPDNSHHGTCADAKHRPRRRIVARHLAFGALDRSAQHSVRRFRLSWLGRFAVELGGH